LLWYWRSLARGNMEAVATHSMAKDARSEPLSLADTAGRLLDECRMVLPGIQALFGFQLIAVFNTRFDRDVPHALQVWHFISVILVAPPSRSSWALCISSTGPTRSRVDGRTRVSWLPRELSAHRRDRTPQSGERHEDAQRSSRSSGGTEPHVRTRRDAG